MPVDAGAKAGDCFHQLALGGEQHAQPIERLGGRWPVGCLVEGTLIDTPSGPTPIEKLRTGDLVIGYKGSPVALQQVHQYREDPSQSRHLTVEFSNGAELQLSRVAPLP